VSELRAARSGLAQQGGRDEAVQVADADAASTAPAPAQSMSAGAAAGSVGTGTATGSDVAASDRPDLHLHLDPTRTQVAVFLGVFFTGLAAALAMTSTRPAGLHRRH
jgi:hypothetical protein